MHAHRTPIVCTTTWTAVMEAAEYRCHCTGQCGNQHSKTEFRCDIDHERAQLVAAPLDLTLSPLAAVRVPVGDLRAWCPKCHAKATTRQRAQRRDHARQEPANIALFDL